jgi:hypothetical protein
MPDARDEEFRLDDLLNDPIVLLLMRRDGVDADELRRLIRSKARRAGPERSRWRAPRRSLAFEARPAA